MTPPPFPLDRTARGSPSIFTSQSRTSISTSVQAGLVAHSIPCTPNPEESRSPSTEGPDEFAGKYAKKFGDCQCVIPGMILESTALRICAKSVCDCGGSCGSDVRI